MAGLHRRHEKRAVGSGTQWNSLFSLTCLTNVLHDPSPQRKEVCKILTYARWSLNSCFYFLKHYLIFTKVTYFVCVCLCTCVCVRACYVSQRKHGGQRTAFRSPFWPPTSLKQNVSHFCGLALYPSLASSLLLLPLCPLFWEFWDCGCTAGPLLVFWYRGMELKLSDLRFYQLTFLFGPWLGHVKCHQCDRWLISYSREDVLRVRMPNNRYYDVRGVELVLPALVLLSCVCPVLFLTYALSSCYPQAHGHFSLKQMLTQSYTGFHIILSWRFKVLKYSADSTQLYHHHPTLLCHISSCAF